MSQVYALNTAKYGTHRLISADIGCGKYVLDVGCGSGYLKSLAENNVYYGIENDSEDAANAEKSGYQRVYKLDLNHYELFKSEKKFDVIIFADILEHLQSPAKVLSFFIDNYLEEGGTAIVSLPNVANFSVRFSLLFGKFDYSESGILDRTHLHLYTDKTARQFIESCSLKIVKRKLSSNNFGAIIKFAPFLSTILGYNLIYVCRKKS